MKSVKNNPVTIVHKLPHDVLEYIHKHYAHATIMDMIETKDSKDDARYYDVDVVDDNNTYRLRFNGHGKFVHEEIEVGKSETDAQEGDPNVIEEKEPSVTDEVIDEF